MIKEIGSEFWDVPTSEHKSNIFPTKTNWYLSGRSALTAIIENLTDCKSVAMPSWCCDSMIYPFIKAGFEVKFYPVYFDSELIVKPSFDCDVLFLMDYFGYTQKPLDLSKYSGIVIRDITHSFFSYEYNDADYYFGSLRKWCGVLTGGFAYSENGEEISKAKAENSEYINLRKQAMKEKERYINNGQIGDKSYLATFEKAEECLENAGIFMADNNDITLANKLDINKIKSTHRENAKVLMTAFSDYLIFKSISNTDCPMFVPILVPNGKRDALRKKLIEEKIYCPIHWQISEYHNIGKNEEYIYNNELSLVCDQRYTTDDMNRMVKVIKEFI